MPDLDFPYHFSGLGRTATTDRDDHIRDLIQQVLFTAPGERVMRPDFGAGLLQLVFEPNSSTLAATTQMLVRLAQTGGHVPDEHLTGLGGIEFQFGDLEVLACSAHDRGLGLHGSLLIAGPADGCGAAPGA